MSLYNIKYLRYQINLQFSFGWYGVKMVGKNVQSVDILVLLKTLKDYSHVYVCDTSGCQD